MGIKKNNNFFKAISLLILTTIVSSCSSIERPTPTGHDIKDRTLIPLTAGQSFIKMTKKSGSDFYTCTMPQPDATFSQSLEDTLGANLFSEEATEGSSEAEMAGRTPTVLMARELFFRTCEFSVNYQLSKEEAFNLFKETLTTVNSLATIQANNTTITVGDTVTATTTNAEGVSVRNQTGEVVPKAAE